MFGKVAVKEKFDELCEITFAGSDVQVMGVIYSKRLLAAFHGTPQLTLWLWRTSQIIPLKS